MLWFNDDPGGSFEYRATYDLDQDVYIYAAQSLQSKYVGGEFAWLDMILIFFNECFHSTVNTIYFYIYLYFNDK